MGVNELTSDELYESGARACLAGRAIWACPVLSADSHQAQSWRAGWADAQAGRYVANGGADIPELRGAQRCPRGVGWRRSVEGL
jgi:hypothetical protein